MSFSVSLLAEAESDFEELHSYIYQRSPQGAERWTEAFQSAMERLRTQLASCGPAYEQFALRRDLRQALFGTKSGRTYRAIFKIVGYRVVVLRIRGPGQRPLTRRDLRQ